MLKKAVGWCMTAALMAAQKSKQALGVVLVACGLSFGSVAMAQAAPVAIDTAAVVAQIGVVPAAITAIALAVLAVIVLIKAYKWVRRAL